VAIAKMIVQEAAIVLLVIQQEFIYTLSSVDVHVATDVDDISVFSRLQNTNLTSLDVFSQSTHFSFMAHAQHSATQTIANGGLCVCKVAKGTC
jgi:hypothetical protein